MKHFWVIFFALISLSAHAQITNPFTQELHKSTTLDTARYKVAYQLRYKRHPADKEYISDVRHVYIGKRHVKDFSDLLFHYDSICTEEAKRGSTTRSNCPGEPWPIELIVNHAHRKADIQYRMPIQTGVLCFRQDVPPYDWTFTEETDTILGYRCTRATTSFAGRDYTAWFSTDISLPFGPYKFGGLPGLILKIQDSEAQFVWEAIGFQKTKIPILKYRYRGEKKCTAEEAGKIIARIFKSPFAFLTAGGGKITVSDSYGRPQKSSDTESYTIPYKPLEIVSR